MQRQKNATPCRTAESHGLGATLVILRWRRRPQLAHPRRNSLPQDPAPKRQLWVLWGREQHPSGRAGLRRPLIAALGSQDRVHELQPASIPQKVDCSLYPASRCVGPWSYLDPSDLGSLADRRPGYSVACSVGPADRIHYPISSASPRPYIHSSVASHSLLAPPPPSSARTEERETRTTPPHSNPGSARTLLAAPGRTWAPVTPCALRPPTDRLCISPLLFNYPGFGTS